MSNENPNENVNAGPAPQGASAPNTAELAAKQRTMRFILFGVYFALAVVLLVLVARYAMPEGMVSGGHQIGVVNVAGLMEEYQRTALDHVIEGDEQAQMAAMSQATAFAERVDQALLVLAERNPGLVLIQSQAVAVEAGLEDYTDDLRAILEPQASPAR
ncbi:hypothetical protein [Thioalkalivibrio sp. ALMg11]|uniref:hypothetical protein n=1 Tax=Thioalkalivibrio sp. ALMg11 TaxID=1158165 RepID=UPI0003740F48|nr:hypothetical protein [Thioalkalivibrio sp. ALMg11]